mgnify:CR=1 FL=1
MSETAEWGNVCSRVDKLVQQLFLLVLKVRRCWLTGRYGAIFMPCATLKNLTAGWENAFMARSRIIMRSFMEQKNV